MTLAIRLCRVAVFVAGEGFVNSLIICPKCLPQVLVLHVAQAQNHGRGKGFDFYDEFEWQEVGIIARLIFEVGFERSVDTLIDGHQAIHLGLFADEFLFEFVDFRLDTLDLGDIAGFLFYFGICIVYLLR